MSSSESVIKRHKELAEKLLKRPGFPGGGLV